MSTDSEHKSAGEPARQADPDRRSVLQGIVGTAVAGTGLAGAGLAIREAQQTDPRQLAIERPDAMSSIRLAINGGAIELTVPDQRTLLLSLREDLGLTGTKKGCNIGQCGACTVLLDGAPVYSCMTLAKDAVGHDVTTIEGLERNGTLHPVQQGFIDKMGSQCGMCTNGMIMCGVGLLQRNPSPSAEEVRLAISGVLCRCGNYPHEVESILAAGGPATARPLVTLAGLLPPFPKAAPAVPAVIDKIADSARLRHLDVDRPALDGFAKATGRARYAGDFGFHRDDPFRNPLFAKVLRSPFAHAEVAAIDDSEARKLPGYRGMVTAADAPDIHSDRRFLNRKARYCGDAVAAVAADNQYTAQEALSRIHVEWRRLEVYPDPEENLRTNNKTIHDGGPVAGFVGPQSANMPTVSYQAGNPDKALAEADHVVEGRYVTGLQCHVPIEPHCCTAVWNGDELTLWDTQQSVFQARETIADALKIDPDKVRILCQYLGGGFGGKCTDNPGKTLYQAIAATLARKTRRPVRLEYTLEELVFGEDTRNPFIFYIKTALDKNGNLTALDCRAVQATGGYASSGPAVVAVAAKAILDTYRCPNVRYTGYSVYTNSPVGGEMRGFGGPQGAFALDAHMDRVAETVGMNPLEFRLKNVKHTGDKAYKDENKETVLGEMRPDDCMRLAAHTIDWEKWQAPSAKTGRLRRGIGMYTGAQHSGRADSDGLIWLDAQGRIHVPLGTGNLGNVSHTGIALIAAQALDMPVDELDVTWADTANAAWTYVTDASRSCHCDGKAVYNAAMDLIRQLKALASTSLGAPADQLAVRDGRILAPNGAAVDFRTIAAGAPPRVEFAPYFDQELDVNPELDEKTGDVVQSPPMKVHPSTEQLARRLSKNGGLVGLGHYVWNPSTQAWGAAFAEVEVDMETGIVRVLRYVSAHDVGRVIYRRGAEAQVHGGAIMGMGFGLNEALILDPNTHIPINGSYIGLGPMTALDYPEIVPVLVESPTASGPYGAKGLGENPVFNAAPAIANAIYNASGVRIDEIPFTWDRVFQRLRAAGRLAA